MASGSSPPPVMMASWPPVRTTPVGDSSPVTTGVFAPVAGFTRVTCPAKASATWSVSPLKRSPNGPFRADATTGAASSKVEVGN